MNKIIKILLSLLIICNATFAQKGATLNISYFDCYTGKRINPNSVLAQKLTSLNLIEKVKNVDIKEQFVFFESGNYNFEINHSDYRTQITNIPIIENVSTKYEFFLQPFKKDSRLETSSIQSKVQDGKMFINGFIADDEGQSIENCEVEIITKGNKVFTDKEGYFELIFSLSNIEEEFIDFRVSKLGFEPKLYTHILCWNKGDWQYQIRLKKGNDTKEALIITSQTGNSHIQSEEELLNKVLQSNPINETPNISAFNNCVPNSIKIGFSTNGTNCCPGGGAGFPSCETYQVLQLDTYIERVVPNEWLASWNSLPNMIEAYKAGAIAARSYSINRINHHVQGYGSFYDICSSPCCQNYGAANSITSAGVNQTTGVVLYYNNDIPLSLYSAENNHLTPQCISGSTIINNSCSNGQFSLNGNCYSDPVSLNKQIAGHGEGMSQRGSARWASGKSLGNCSNSVSNLPNTGYSTKNYTQILSQYYPTYSVSNFSNCTNTAPPNDNCSISTAESITSNGACKIGTVAGATGSYGANQCSGCSCISPDDNDVYYSFVAVTSSHTVNISNYASNFDAVIELRTACSTGTMISCYDPSGIPSTVSRTWTSLTIGQTYYIRVFEFNSIGTPPSSSTFTICVTHTASCTPPSSPTASSPTSITTSSFTANWNSVAGATSYLLDVSVSSNFTSYLVGYQGLEITSLSKTVSGLGCGSTYYYRVRAKNICESANSLVITATVSACNSGTPTNDNCNGATALTFNSFYFPAYYANIGATPSGFASCVGTQDDDVFFKFVPNKNFASITVESRINFDAVFQVLSGSCGGGMTELACVNNTGVGGVETVTITGLTIGATYYIRVWHYGVGTSSNADFYISAYGGCPAPPSPILASPTNATSTSFQANWNPISNVGYYAIDVSLYSDFRSYLPNYSRFNVGNTTSYNITGLTCNTTYYYRIAGFVGCVDGSFSGSNTGYMAATTLSNCCTVLSAPTASSASNTTNTSFIANWTQIANADYYRIDISTNQNFTTYVSGYQDFIVNGTSYMINGLSCGTLYYYRIKAVSSTCGTSNNSNVIGVTTTNITPTSNFQANTPTSINIGGTIQFQSNATQNPDSYIWTFSGGTPSSSTSITPIIQYNTAGVYNVIFQAHNDCGWGNINTATNFVTVLNCIDNPVLPTYNSGNVVQIKAPNTITATNRINSGANILYQAGKTIILNAGFVVAQGAIFKAQMGGCNN